MARALELCCTTVRQASLPELIDVAAATGFASVTSTTWLYERAGVSDADLRGRLDDAGVAVGYVDGLSSPLPGTPQGASEDRCFAIADALGTTVINVVHFGGRPTAFAEMADAIGGLAERAARRGIRLILEFLPGTGMPDLPVTLDLVRAAGADRVGVLLDTWHLARTGGGPDLLVGDAPSLVGAVQVSDRVRAQDDAPYVPMSGRYLPGEGELPLVEILTRVLAARPDLPVGVEVINDELRAMAAADAAAAAGRALRALLARVP